MDGSHDYFSFRERRRQFWLERLAELDERGARLKEQSRVAIVRSRALLERTRSQVAQESPCAVSSPPSPADRAGPRLTS